MLVETFYFAGEDTAVVRGGEAGDVLEQDEVERAAVTVQTEGYGEESGHELAAGIVRERGAICRGETLAGRATDYRGWRELGAVVAIHVSEPNAPKVGNVATVAAGAVAVPRSDGIGSDVIGQSDRVAGTFEAEVQAAATREEAQEHGPSPRG